MTSALRGGGGVDPKADRVIQLSKGGCVNLRTRGVQKSQNFADVICVWPLNLISLFTINYRCELCSTDTNNVKLIHFP